MDVRVIEIQKNQSRFCFEETLGAQVLSWIPNIKNLPKNHSLILPYDPKKPFFLSGNYLLFPWVNRISLFPKEFGNRESVPAKDGNGIPVHGLVFDAQWTVLQKREDFVTLQCNLKIPESITEIAMSLTISIAEKSVAYDLEITNLSNHSFPLAVGWHPYFSFPDTFKNSKIRIEDAKLIPLNSDLLPIYRQTKLEDKSTSPKEAIEIDLAEETQLDHLYAGTKLVYANRENGLGLSIFSSPNSKIPIRYFQIYTPTDRKAIALEPMSNGGNFLEGPSEEILSLSPNQKTNFAIVYEVFEL